MKQPCSDHPAQPGSPGPKQGVVAGIGAYLLWGFAPIYFKLVASVPALEVLAHRIIWSTVLLITVLWIRKDFRSTLACLRKRETLRLLFISTSLIALNWLTFIWAVAHDRVLEASLGYYINPLINVLLGRIVLKEILSPVQGFCVVLALTGVGYLTYSHGGLPWVAVTLALTFGLYSLVRKTTPLNALEGLAAETAILFPMAIAYLLYIIVKGSSHFPGGSASINCLLIAAGLVTTIPLLLFGFAARRLRLITLGFLQYIAPTCSFMLAVLAWGEPFDATRRICFVLIWIALGVYSIEALLTVRRNRAGSLTGEAFLE